MGVNRASVLVSGGGCNTPFTTPDRACETGLAAGGQLTALRSALLDGGIAVYTCPTRVGGGVIADDPGWGAFADGPSPLPAEMTINSVAPVPESGEQLSRFIVHLVESEGITDIDLVGFSLGGVVAQDAIQRIQQASVAVRMRSLISVATPWLGSFVLRQNMASVPLPPEIAAFVGSFISDVDVTVSREQRVGDRNLPVWATGYDHVLDGLPLTRVAGTYFPEVAVTEEGSGIQTVVEAHDGFCTRMSALGLDGDPVVLPPAACFEVPYLHSNYLADLIDEPWERSINWNPDVGAIVVDAIRSARAA